METMLLIILAVAPSAFFMYLIYFMDRHEPESMRTILTAIAVGALSVVPAVIIQLSFENIGLFRIGGLPGAFFDSFLLVAPSEEFFKFLLIFLYLRNKPFYDELNDGIVYYGAGAIGFALFENIFYVLDYGFSTGILRAFTAFPIHTFCGVVIGYHAGLARFSNREHPNRIIFRGLFIAYLTHAFYNTLLMAESMLTLLVIPLLTAVYVCGYLILLKGRRISLAGAGASHTFTVRHPSDNVFAKLPPAVTSPSPALPQAEKQASRSVFIPGEGKAPPERLIAAGGTAINSFAAYPVTNYRLEEVATDDKGKRFLPPKRETWKAVVGRILLILSAVLWFLAFIGDDGTVTGRVELLLGLVMITVIPIMIGLLLELSYRRRKRVAIYLD